MRRHSGRQVVTRLMMAAGLALMLVAGAIGCKNAPQVRREQEIQRFNEQLQRQAQEANAQPAQPLSLAECERIAVANSLDLRVRQLALQLQDEQVRLALSGGLPRASAQYNDTVRSNKVLTEDSSGNQTEIADRHQQSASVQAVVPVLDWGLTYYSYQIALDRRRQERLLVARAEQLLRRDVRIAYTQYAGALRQEKLLALAYQAAGEVLRVARNLEREQLAARADTSLVEAALAQARLELSLARQRVQQTHLTLSQLMSLPPGMRFTVYEAPPELPAPPTAELVAAYENRALVARPELAVQDLERHISANAVRRDAAAFFPRVDLLGGYNWTNQSGLVNPSWFVGGVQVTHSLLDGGADIWRYQLSRKTANLEQTRTLLLSLGVLYEVDFLALRVKQAHETVDVSQTLESSRRIALERIISLYREGLEDEAGAARSLADLTIQSTTLDRAITDYISAWYELEAAVLPQTPATTQPTSRPTTGGILEQLMATAGVTPAPPLAATTRAIPATRPTTLPTTTTTTTTVPTTGETQP